LASANVVGYSTTALKAGATATGASFVTVGGEGCKLTTIKPTNLPAGYKGAINIQTLDYLGNKVAKYYYHEGESGRGAKADGWWLENTTLITAENDVTFKVGEGLWVTGLDGAALSTSGEVVFDNVSCDLRAGATMVVNPYPVAIKLSTIKPKNLPAGYKGAINIQTLDYLGNKIAAYIYHEGETGRGAKADGWWLENTTLITPEADVEFPVGQGLWVTGVDGTKLEFTFPASAK
jgi:hypothetical protein